MNFIVFAVWGYVNLSLSVFEYKDIIDKEMSGRLGCGNKSGLVGGDPGGGGGLIPERRVRNALIPSFLESKDEVILQWNCSHAAKIMTTCSQAQTIDEVVNISLPLTGKEFFKINYLFII